MAVAFQQDKTKTTDLRYTDGKASAQTKRTPFDNKEYIKTLHQQAN